MPGKAERQRAASARPVGWLTKPFTSDQLVASVRRAFARPA